MLHKGKLTLRIIYLFLVCLFVCCCCCLFVFVFCSCFFFFFGGWVFFLFVFFFFFFLVLFCCCCCCCFFFVFCFSCVCVFFFLFFYFYFFIFLFFYFFLLLLFFWGFFLVGMGLCCSCCYCYCSCCCKWWWWWWWSGVMVVVAAATAVAASVIMVVVVAVVVVVAAAMIHLSHTKLRGINQLTRVTALSKLFWFFSEKGVLSKRKVFGPTGTKYLPFTEDPVSKWTCCAGKQQKVTKVVSLVKNGRRYPVYQVSLSNKSYLPSSVVTVAIFTPIRHNKYCVINVFEKYSFSSTLRQTDRQTQNIQREREVRREISRLQDILIILITMNLKITVDSRYIEVQGTRWNSSRYPYFVISVL